MDATTALNLVTTVISTLVKVEPVIVQGITDLKPFASALYQKFTGQEISADERTALEAKIDELSAEFQQPIPPEDQQ